MFPTFYLLKDDGNPPDARLDRTVRKLTTSCIGLCWPGRRGARKNLLLFKQVEHSRTQGVLNIWDHLEPWQTFPACSKALVGQAKISTFVCVQSEVGQWRDANAVSNMNKYDIDRCLINVRRRRNHHIS